MRKWFLHFWNTVSTILQIKDIVLLVFGLGGTGGAPLMIQFLKEVPIAWPIALGIVGFGFIIIEILRISVGLRKWRVLVTTKTETIDSVLDQLLNMHQQLGRVAKVFYRKRLEPDKQMKVARRVLKVLNIPESQLWYRNPNDITRLLTKKAKKVYKITSQDFTSICGLLSEIGDALDEVSCGIGHVRNEKKYQQDHAKLMKLELQLPPVIRPPALDLLNRAYEVSYGLHSITIWMAASHNVYGTQIPEDYAQLERTMVKQSDEIYLKVLHQVKRSIIKSFYDEL